MVPARQAEIELEHADKSTVTVYIYIHTHTHIYIYIHICRIHMDIHNRIIEDSWAKAKDD